MTEEIQLRGALEHNELLLHYQPKVDLKTGKVTELEALIRWQHPERGTLLPVEFIPLAEETGLIVPIGDWVLQTACIQNKAWQDQGLPPVRVTVNLSPRHFEQEGFAHTIQTLLTKTGLGPKHLGLELTEIRMMYDVDLAIKTMSQLRAIGVRLALDNFGTGYSSLSYLKSFPIDMLQIDGSYVRDVDSNADSANCASAIIAVARTLGLQVTAERVETEGQLAFLRERRCDMMQGFLFSKPLPPTELGELLRQGRSLPGPVTTQ